MEITNKDFSKIAQLLRDALAETEAKGAEAEVEHHKTDWIDRAAFQAQIDSLKLEHAQRVSALKANFEIERETFKADQAKIARLKAEVERLTAERALSVDREWLGKLVRLAWVKWAQTQPDAKPSWLLPWEELDEPNKEADRQIGEFIASQCVTPEMLKLESRLAKAERERDELQGIANEKSDFIGVQINEIHKLQYDLERARGGTMKDEEVGELWRSSTLLQKAGDTCPSCSVGKIQLCGPAMAMCTRCHWKRTIDLEKVALIRKLVEERTKGNWALLPFVLRDFNIDPATWPKEML